MVRELDKQSFEEALRIPGKPIVVDYSTDWCPYCKLLAPIIEEVANEHANEIQVYYVDIDEQPDIAQKYEVMTIPSIFVFFNCELIRTSVNPGTKEALLKVIFGEEQG